MGVFGALALNGAGGGEKGFWITFVALLVAITVVAGALMVFLVRWARRDSTQDGQIGTGSDGARGEDGRQP